MGKYSDGRTMTITVIPRPWISDREYRRRLDVRRKKDREAENLARKLTAHMKLDQDKPL
jgi:hypothetical protein